MQDGMARQTDELLRGARAEAGAGASRKNNRIGSRGGR